MRKEELSVVVALHAQWLQSGGKSGRQANLENADLRQADLRNVDLSYATLAGANLERAELAGANLHNADLRRINIGYANLAGADLGSANLQQAVAMGVDLTGANLTESIMLDVRCDHSCLQVANLTGVLARKTVFYQCDLSSAILDRADLSNADLRHANLTSASIIYTRFDGAKLNGALFTSAQGQLLAIAQSIQNQSEEDLSLEDRQIMASRRRLLKLVMTVQKVALWVSLLGLVVCVVVGVFDLYAISRDWLLSAATGFNYLAALTISVVGALVTTSAAVFRLRILEGVRQQRVTQTMSQSAVSEPQSNNMLGGSGQMNIVSE